MINTISLGVSDRRLGCFPRKMSAVVRAAAVAAPLLGLTMTLYPQETLAKPHALPRQLPHQPGEDIVDTVVVREEINRNNCLGTQSPVNGRRVIVTPCQNNSNQTSWAFFDGILMNLGLPDNQCVAVNGNRFAEGSQLVVGSCDDHTVMRWELTGGKFVAHDDLCLDADHGLNSVAVLRKCAFEAGGYRDPRRTDQYWDLVPTP